MIKKIAIFMFVIVISGCGGIEEWIHDDVSQEFTIKTFNKNDLEEDLEFLISEMAARHPVFHELTDEASLSAKVDSLRIDLEDGMTRKHFFDLIGKLNPYFRDGHSIIFPLLAEGVYYENEDQFLFPFGVFVNNGSLYINKTYRHKSSGDVIEKGEEVISINGVTGSTILKELATYGHGETATLRMHMSTLLFPYWLQAVYGWHGEFKLVLKKGTNQRTLLAKNPESWDSEVSQKGYNWLDVLPNKTAYLKLGSFDVDEEAGFDEFVEDSFEKIKKEKLTKLIIDVRGNTGGQTDAGAEVISYLTDKELSQASSALEKLNEDNNGFFGYKGEPGEIIDMDIANNETIQPAEESKRFEGEIIVLIDEMTYSAGIVFATIIQDYELAKLVGQPTGGHANQTGNLSPFYLPNTKLLILAPSRYIIRVSGDKRKQRVQPDVLVEKGTDMRSDKTLEVALNLFEK